MKISVVIPTYNQQERLRLVLCGLQHQTLAADHFELIVIDDGSTDCTGELLEKLAMPNLRILRPGVNQGRNRARNLGIAAAGGELIVFLDGDALPAPELLQRYWDAYLESEKQAVLCGFQYSLRELEYLKEPQTGRLIAGDLPSVVHDYLNAHLDELKLTEAQVRGDFSAIRLRACEGGYPFPESAERQRQVLAMFTARPESAVCWLGFIPHNGAIPHRLLTAAGGFDEQIPFSEGWELAYRLQRFFKAQVAPVPAESFHLYHHHEFSEPEAAWQEALRRYQAIEYMARKYGDSRIRMLYFWYAHLWPDPFMPEESLIDDLVEFDRRYREMPEEMWQEHQTILEYHPAIYPLLEETEVDDESKS